MYRYFERDRLRIWPNLNAPDKKRRGVKLVCKFCSRISSHGGPGFYQNAKFIGNDVSHSFRPSSKELVRKLSEQLKYSFEHSFSTHCIFGNKPCMTQSYVEKAIHLRFLVNICVYQSWLVQGAYDTKQLVRAHLQPTKSLESLKRGSLLFIIVHWGQASLSRGVCNQLRHHANKKKLFFHWIKSVLNRWIDTSSYKF